MSTVQHVVQHVVQPTVAPPATEEDDHDRFAHMVPKDKLVDSMVYGIPVTALCGKHWVPSRDPERFPVCPGCLEVARGLKAKVES